MTRRHDLTTIATRDDRPLRRLAVILVLALTFTLVPLPGLTAMAQTEDEAATVPAETTEASLPSPEPETPVAEPTPESTPATEDVPAAAEPVEQTVSTEIATETEPAAEATPTEGATETVTETATEAATSDLSPTPTETPTEIPTEATTATPDASPSAEVDGAATEPSGDPVATETATETATTPTAEATPVAEATETVVPEQTKALAAAVLEPESEAGFAAAAAPTPPPGYGLIAISLVDQNGLPVAGATFRVSAWTTVIATVVTDAAGEAYVTAPAWTTLVRVRMQNKAPNCSSHTSPENYDFLLLPPGVTETPFTTTCTSTDPTYAATATATCASLPQPRLRVGATTAGNVGAVTIANTGTAALTYAYDVVDTRTGAVLVANAGSGSVAVGQSVTPLFGTTILAADAAGWSLQRTVVVRFTTASGGATGIADLRPTLDCAFEPYLALSLTTTCPAVMPLLPGATMTVALATANSGDAPLGSPALGSTIAGSFGAAGFTHTSVPNDFIAGSLTGNLTATATGTPPVGSTGAAVYGGYAVGSTAAIACPVGRSAPRASGQSITLPAVDFSLADQTTTGALTIGVTNSDVAGWTVTVAAGPFVYVGPNYGVSIPSGSFAISNAAAPVADPAGQPAGGSTGPVVPAGATGAFGAPRTVLAAGPNGGIGAYSQTIDVQLTVPGGSVSGAYVAELTITAAAGP